MSNNFVDMNAMEMCEIFSQCRPQLFDYIYKECAVIYKSQHNTETTIAENEYFDHGEINLAKAIIYDMNKETANKIGKIIVAATD